MGYKYHSPAEYDRIIRECEVELDQREEQRAEAERLERVRQWAQDPANSQQLAQIRAEMDRAESEHRAKYGQQHPTTTAQQRPAAPMGTPQNPIPANARFDPSHLKNQLLQISSIQDPLVK
jgi:hypothetical protein